MKFRPPHGLRPPRRRRSASAVAASLWLVLCAVAHAHHASAGIYDRARTAVVQGTVEEVFWRNPHVQFTVRGTNRSGRRALWKIEGASVAMLSRHGIAAGTLEVGDRIRVAGYASVHDLPRMYATNLLLPDGREILMDARIEPRWSKNAVRWSDWVQFPAAAVEAARRKAHGIFRVWTTDFDHRQSLWKTSYPLTNAAAAARAKWDPKKSPYLYGCKKGMPIIMEQPYPLEFTEAADGDIVLRLEEFDTVRTIAMSSKKRTQNASPSIFGRSSGRWDGDALVVTTTGISWPYFDQSGIPLHETSTLVERFAPSADGNRLDYTLTATDPTIFTAPVVLHTFWVWKPGERVQPFDCPTGRAP